MKPLPSGQVALSKLIFTHNWEDPLCDEQALHIQEGDTVFTITSGGCNTLGFLRFYPRAIYCVDINPAQTYVMELKQAAIRNLGYGQFAQFMGLTECHNRMEIYQQISRDLSPEAALFWAQHLSKIKAGLIMNGRFEGFVKIAGSLLRLLQGRSKVSAFLQLSDLQAQQEFYSRRWDNKAWRWIFKMMFNKKRLAKRGLNAGYFYFDDGSASFSESFYNRAKKGMTATPAQQNYFLSLYFTGKYQFVNEMPAFLKQENFEIIKQHIDRIHPITADSKYWLQQQPANFFDCMSLSNICELMDLYDTHKLFTEVKRTGKPGARIIFRNLMIPREVPEDLAEAIIKDEGLSKHLLQTDRSFVYGKVATYTLKK